DRAGAGPMAASRHRAREAAGSPRAARRAATACTVLALVNTTQSKRSRARKAASRRWGSGGGPRRMTGSSTGCAPAAAKARLNAGAWRSEEHTSELQSRENLVCRLLLEKKNKKTSLE